MFPKSIYHLIIIYCAINFCSSDENELPEVTTPLGKVRGTWKTSVGGRKYAAFEGIPYAKPPVGDLRFEEPQPISPWSGVWEADITHTCLQIGFFNPDSIEGEESCLYLNVFLPAEFINNPKNLDVVVGIHGGGFLVGSGHLLFESSTLLDRDIVLVTINYRLGILGFLSTEDSAIPGNNGMKDQVLALKWVKDNIASFGGNPESVTITGQSAGGASVHFHYFSPLSKALFHKGVAQSGTALAPWVLKKNPLQNAKKLAVLVGCPDDSTEDLKSCLKQRPVQNLLRQMRHFYGYLFMPFSPFAPTVEKGSSRSFLNKDPYLLLKEGNVHDVPLITSTTTDEGLLSTGFLWDQLEEVNKNWAEIFPYVLDCNETLPASRRETVSKAVLKHYLGPDQKISQKNFYKFTQIFTDRLFGHSAEVAAKMQASVTKSPVYYYLFNYQKGENSLTSLFAKSNEVRGVAHGDDTIYCYGTFQVKPLSKQDERLRSLCQDMLYSFVSTGKPSFDGSDIWQPTGSSELTFLNITAPDNMKLQKTESFSSSDFWSNLGLLEHENLIVKDEL